MSPLMIVLIVVAALVLALILVYNSLIRSKVRVEEAWSDITVQLKRRADLIPNLVNAVKGYAAHEKGVFEEVTKARAKVLEAKGPRDAAAADNVFQQALKSLFAVAENYPDLKASQNFLDLQDELTDTEDKIQAARRFYNGSVRDFNTKLEVFPTRMFARTLGFTKREFFELEADEAAAAEQPAKVDI